MRKEAGSDGPGRGDPNACRHLVDRDQGQIHRLASGLSGYQSGNVDDVVQEVFVKACCYLKRFREEAGSANWIYRIANS